MEICKIGQPVHFFPSKCCCEENNTKLERLSADVSEIKSTRSLILKMMQSITSTSTAATTTNQHHASTHQAPTEIPWYTDCDVSVAPNCFQPCTPPPLPPPISLPLSAPISSAPIPPISSARIAPVPSTPTAQGSATPVPASSTPLTPASSSPPILPTLLQQPSFLSSVKLNSAPGPICHQLGSQAFHS